MSTFTCEPGARIGGRYRLEDRVDAGSGWSAWKAIDEILARPVTVLTLAPGFPRAGEVVTAARAASRLTDARLSQVFDVEENWDQAYVVMEWVGGDSLDDILAGGPLDPGRSAWIIAESAQALATAHAAGLAHLRLTPGSLRYAPGGGVKITGLGIDAALAGVTSEDPGVADTRGLGRLLYAAVTAHWPGPDWPDLPPAPVVDGDLLSPRQVCAGVPAGVDEVTGQALSQRPRRGRPPITTPALLAEALAEVIPAPPAPPAAERTPRGAAPMPPGGTGPDWDPGPRYERSADPSRREPGRRQQPRRGRVVAALVGVVALAAVGLAWTLGHHTPTPAAANTTHHHHQATPPQAAPKVTVLHPVSASGFDPLSSAKQDPQDENSQQAKRAIDNNPRSAWHTQYYLNDPRFGGTKAGTGLILDMGSVPVSLRSVTVTFGPTAGANVRIELGNSDVRARHTLREFTPVASGTDLSGKYTFTVHSPATGRYLLIWFTKLPHQAHGPSSHYEAEVFNVVVRGTR